jgi:hypothetical protein
VAKRPRDPSELAKQVFDKSKLRHYPVVAFNGVTAASMVQVLPYRYRLKDLNEALGQDKRFQRGKQRLGNRQGRGWSGFRLAK